MSTTGSIKAAGNLYRIELLQNGFYRVDHRGSDLVSLLGSDGSVYSGAAVPVKIEQYVRSLSRRESWATA